MGQAMFDARSPDNERSDIGPDIQLCARGHRRALQRLFESEAARMKGVALRILRRHDLAEEAVQECFVTVWQKAASYNPSLGSGRAWLYTILRHKALNILRDGQREQLTGFIEERMDQPPVWEEAYRRLDGGSRLRQCLDVLDPAKRSAILMAHVVGYSHGEVAALLRVPLGTAKAWIRRGLIALRECLG